MRKKSYSMAIIMCLIMLAGCASSSYTHSTDKEPTGLGVSADIHFVDLPVPLGFKMVRENSFVFQNNVTRVGLLRYQGRANALDVIDFYKKQMVNFNWNLLNTVEYGNITMNFENKNETCIVTISPQATSTVVVVSVAPKSAAAVGRARETYTDK